MTTLKAILFMMLALTATLASAAPAPPLFPFDNGLTDVKSVEDQGALLRELGYSGICTRPNHATPEFFAAMDKHGLKVCATYVVLGAARATRSR